MDPELGDEVLVLQLVFLQENVDDVANYKYM